MPILPAEPVRHVGRRLTWFRRALPDFLILGAMKAGTTSLFRYVAQHPDVVPPVKKEVQFFSTQWRRGVAWYRSHFPDRRDVGDGLTGEASPYYLAHPDAPTRAAHVVPWARLIAVLRDPADRAWSHFQYLEGGDVAAFERALDREEQCIGEVGLAAAYDRRRSYLTRGLYARQLANWMEAFPEDALEVLFFEEMKESPRAAYDASCRHLGIEPASGQRFPRHNVTRNKRPLPKSLRRRLDRFFEEANHEPEGMLGRPVPW